MIHWNERGNENFLHVMYRRREFDLNIRIYHCIVWHERHEFDRWCVWFDDCKKMVGLDGQNLEFKTRAEARDFAERSLTAVNCQFMRV